MTTTENIRKELQALVDAKYKEFHSSLLPGANNILGVRIPQLRIMAKEIIKKELQGEWVLVTAWGALYDAKIFKELRFPCGRHYEDEYVFVSVFENQECVVCIPENIYYYLQRADSIMGVTYKKQDCMDYFEMWHERIDYFQAKEDRELLAPVIQSCLAWNVLYLAMNGEAMEEPEKRLLKKDIRKYFWKIFAKPYLYNWKESVKLAVKCVMVLMNDKSLGKRYV